MGDGHRPVNRKSGMENGEWEMGIVNKMEDSPLRSAIHQRGADRYCLQQCVELVHAEIGLPQDCAQRTAIELFVVGDYELGVCRT